MKRPATARTAARARARSRYAPAPLPRRLSPLVLSVCALVVRKHLADFERYVAQHAADTTSYAVVVCAVDCVVRVHGRVV